MTRSQISDFTSGTVASATTSGTATYATTSGTSVSISGSITKSQVSDFTSGTVTTISGNITKSQISDFTSGTVASATLAGTATYSTTSGTAVYATTSGTAVYATNTGYSFTGGTLTSALTLKANGTAAGSAALYWGTTSPALLSSAVQGANEYDGLAFYKTPSVSATSGRGVDVASYYYATSSAGYAFDFSASASAQSILGGGTIGLTLLAGSSYEVEYAVSLTQAYFGDSRNFTAGYATTTVSGSPVTNFSHILDFGSNTTSAITATTMQSYGFAVSNTLVVSASIATGSRYTLYRAKGILRVTGTGSVKFYPTLTPSATVANNTITVNGGTYLKITPIGNGTVTQVGAFA